MLETLLATGLTLGLHLGTWHENSRFSDFNPGVYAIASSGLTGGLYLNSERRPSAYLGCTFYTPGRNFALLVGGVTGYSQAPLVPMVVPSARWKLGEGVYGRISLLSKPPGRDWGLAGAHFSVERSW